MVRRALQRKNLFLIIQILLFVGVAVAYALASTGTYHDDDLDHFFMARGAFAHPAFFLDAWGRPAFTLFYALPAQLGLNAVRLTTVLVAAAAGMLTLAAARREGYLMADAAAGLTLWQPLFFYLSFSALAEPLGALGVAAILLSVARDDRHRAAVFTGLLPLARLELGVVAVPVAIWLLSRRAIKPLVWLVVPVAAWALAGALAHGDPLWLLHVVHGTERPLATTGPLHYLRNDIVVVGPTLFLGFVLGAAVLLTPGPGPRPVFAGVLWTVVFGSIALLSWDKLKLGGSIGFLRHLIVLAPAVTLVALAGFEALVRGVRGARRTVLIALIGLVAGGVGLFLSHRLVADYYIRPGRDWSRFLGMLPVAAFALALALRRGAAGVAAGTASAEAAASRPSAGAAAGTPIAEAGAAARRRLAFRAGLVVVTSAAGFCLATLRPIGLNVERKTVKAGVDFLRTEGYLNRPLLADHPWVYWFTGRDRWDRRSTPYVTQDNLEAAPRGAVIFWENHYGSRLYGDVSRAMIDEDGRFERLFEVQSGDGQFQVVIYEKERQAAP